MKAPIEILERSIYYTENIVQDEKGVVRSNFIFESGKWYKPNRYISLVWNIAEKSQNNYSYVPTQDIFELRHHLREYFEARS